MKRAFLLLSLIATATFAVSQSPAAGQTQPSKPSQAGSTVQSGAAAQGTQATPGAQTTPATQAEPAPHSKGAPQARTQEEFKAYQDVIAKTDPQQMEAATDDFAQKFPNSELRTVIYNQLLNVYRNGGATDKAIAVGRKSLAIDPTDPVPNVMVAMSIAQSTRDTDLDKDDRLNEAVKDAQRAIDNIDTGMAIPPNTPPEKVAAAKASLLEMANETLGQVNLNRKDFAGAEAAFRKAIDANKAEPDGVLYLRLAIALDNQKKYQEALQATDTAIKYSQPGSDAMNWANQEKSRLQKLAGTAPASSAAPTAQ
ncbi:Tetratricopeptide region [Candidatus Koribacter versatilis Ellin345]|uniref:Tetratricopeptide region n=1 Tax=Koribacter versatilis (strain Ellin345) TaxID=204669 RepID=Q1IJU7_KORVE|nr:tetratricopeptide repeat protein [Candidatus Koribacter versatilis]ABF42853.1 Tetratricopeptide region [Candidatus Koribacter versatilis Ellin345]